MGGPAWSPLKWLCGSFPCAPFPCPGSFDSYRCGMKNIRIGRMSDETLLKLRLRDLPVRIEGTFLEDAVSDLHEELENRNLLFRPHVWLSTEFYTPDGVPGFAIPFYLAHPRLMR